jgi:hypothetical protein
LNVLSRTIKYLEDWYDYLESQLKLFSVLNLKESTNLPIADVMKITQTLNVVIDEDFLFDEVDVIEENLKMIQNLPEKGVDKI